MADPPLIVQTLCAVEIDSIINLCKLLETCLIFSSETIHVQSGVNSELDYLVTINQELEDFLFKLTELEKDQLKGINFSRIILRYLQGVGYVIELVFKNAEFPHSFDVEGYSFQFSADDSLYFKTPRTLALDEKFGNMQAKIREAENGIIIKIEAEVLLTEDSLALVSSKIGELDACFSLVLFAESYHLSRPKLFDDPRVQIVNGRHLLVEICVNNYIPNDCALDQVHRIAVITGPNYSGKSIYMKTVGIIVYLAHVGCFVPAEIAEIGLCDQIFSRIQATETRYSSSFADEICQVSVALNNCTQNSLLLLDEFGKGTCTLDGMSLVYGLLKELENNVLGTVLLTTHYQELISYSYVKESSVLKFYTMEMADADEPVFLYKLTRGLPNGSHGILCAK